MIASERQRRVLVLGGTGLLGAEIARAYIADGTPVTVLARHRPTGERAVWLRSAKQILGTAEDPAVLSEALEDAGHVVHALGSPPPGATAAEPLAQHVSVVPTLLGVLDALRVRPGVSLTYLSSGGAVYGNDCPLPASEDSACHPVSAYGVTKLTAEHFIEVYAGLHGTPARILRVANAYGPQQSPDTGQGVVATFLNAALTGESVRVYGDGSNVRDYVEASDVASAVVRLSGHADGVRVVNVGSGTGHSISQVLEIVEATTGRRLPVEWAASRQTDVSAVYVDTSRLRQLIEWHPMPLAEGVAAMWAAWCTSEVPITGQRA
jgi:UDP-glucose 4-epimerase